jgi:L-ribulokinase
MKKNYAVGMDFGTNSCRSLIVDLSDGSEVADFVYDYPTGEDGVIIDSKDPHLARQNPRDYLTGMEISVKEALKEAKLNRAGFDCRSIIGIGVDTTGSSPMPVDEKGVPLGLTMPFQNNPNAMVWLWKDHTSFQEAGEITQTARKLRPEYLTKIGGTYSSEWFWSKILHLKRVDPDVFQAAYSFIEICDYIPAVLCGVTRPEKIKRSVCAAGHKAMYSEQWGGLPDREFLAALDSELAGLRDRLYEKAVPSNHSAGWLSEEWAQKLGLNPGIAVAVGAFDAHMGAVGAGVKEGTLVKILGTSTCDVMVSPGDRELADIPGVCGIVRGSVLPDDYGIEAGQSAVGDIFLWFIHNLVPEEYGGSADEKFLNLDRAAAAQKPGEHGLIALDWNNGNRTILVDVRLSGLLIGHTLHTQAHEIYRALIESTAFGALTIVKRIEEYGVSINDIVSCGGLAAKSPFLMQIYADILGRAMFVSRSDQTPALGAALFGAVCAGKDSGGFSSVEEAQKQMTGTKEVFKPRTEDHKIYQKMYAWYRELHDAFGTREWSGSLYHAMKNLIALRERQRKGS